MIHLNLSFRLTALALFSFSLVCFPKLLAEQVYDDYAFATLAGVPETGPGYFDGTAGAARFDTPGGVARDSYGNIYLADISNHTIRKITPGGVVTTLAGVAGVPGSADGIGSAARFYAPQSVAVDSSDNIYVTDFANHTIRKITAGGVVTTLAGLAGSAGKDDGVGSAARFNHPVGIAVGSGNKVVVVDTDNHALRQIMPDGTVTTPVGTGGTPGKADGTGNAAQFRYPQFIVLDSSGNIFLSDGGNHTIRKISTAWKVTTLAGLAGTAGTNNGTGTSARFNTPCGVVLSGSGYLFVADYENHAIRRVAGSGEVTTVAGVPGSAGSVDAKGSSAMFNHPLGLGVDTDKETLLVTDANHTLRKVSSSAVVTTFAGYPVIAGVANGKGSSAGFTAPQDIAVDPAGNLYVADEINCTIRKITPDGTVSTLAGSPRVPGTTDGTGSAARFYLPVGVAVDATGTVYVADTYNHTIRKITPAGVVSTLAGLAGASGSTDATGKDARFFRPFRLAVAPSGAIIVADTGNHAIRKVTLDGVVTTIAGSPGLTGATNGVGSEARFFFPEGIAVDADENIYVADDGNHTIRKITPDGTVSTYAGTPGSAGVADGPRTSALFNFPFGLAIDQNRNLYVGDSASGTVRKIAENGTVTTLGGAPGRVGNLHGTGRFALLGQPAGVAVDTEGNIYLADPSENIIRKGYRPLTDRPFAQRSGSSSLFNLDVNNLTTTTWSWKLVRQPSSSAAQFAASSLRNPTFQPDVEDLFVFRFEGTDSLGRVTAGNVAVQLDSVAPLLAILSPTPNQSVSGSQVVLEGTAQDNQGIVSVFCQVNDGNWTPAATTNNWMNWSASLSLSPGANVLRAYAVDLAGNHSATGEVSVTSTQAPTFRIGISTRSGAGIQVTDIAVEGAVGAQGQLEASTDLVKWSTLRTFAMTNSIIHFSDSVFNPPGHQFFRAIGP